MLLCCVLGVCMIGCVVCVCEPVITVCGPHVIVPVMTLCGLFRLQAVGTALTDSAQQSISGQKQSAKVEPGSVHADCNHYYNTTYMTCHCITVALSVTADNSVSVCSV